MLNSLYRSGVHGSTAWRAVCAAAVAMAGFWAQAVTAVEAGAIPVELVQRDGAWVLLRGGEPYTVRGAGGYQHLELLKAMGGNSIRTWGADDLGPLLDRAHELGLSVTVGIWLGHERHGFDYNDAQQVREQFERARSYVEQYKDHPAVLLWGIGNEMEGNGQNPKVWQAVQAIAEMIHELDPNHPTMTVTAELGRDHGKQLMRYCPDIDVWGINSYAGIHSMPERMAEQGWTGPYVVTEFGPQGQWEVGHTEWGVPIEQSAADKADHYHRAYQHAIEDQPKQALGSYVFLWGAKQEVTDTWYSMILDGSLKTPQVDVISRHWTGRWPENRAPLAKAIESELTLAKVKPGGQVEARLVVTDPDGDPLRVTWRVQHETRDRRQGGDREAAPPIVEDAVLQAQGKTAVIRIPDEPGPYRLYAFAYDDKGSAAAVNVPFFVEE